MNKWYVENKSYSYSNKNGSVNSKEYSYINSNEHKEPIEECFINNKKVNCNEQEPYQLALENEIKTKNFVQNGEVCNGSLPPQYATFCDKGLKCQIENPMPGASGICVPNNSNFKNKYLKYKKKYLKLIQKNLKAG